MGAVPFITFQVGDDAETSFREAVDLSQHVYGVGGYSGTIAEKNEFVTIDPPQPSKEQAVGYARTLIEGNDPVIADKNGPAGAFRVLDGHDGPGWVFFGFASL